MIDINASTVVDSADIPRVMKYIRTTLQRDFDNDWDAFCRNAQSIARLAITKGGFTAAVAISSLKKFGDRSDLFQKYDVEEYFDFLDQFEDSADVSRNLLCMGFDLRGTGLHGWNAFCYAVWRRKRACIPYIALAGADPNFRVGCDDYLTPLEMAITKNDSEMLVALIAAGADLNVVHPVTLQCPLDLAESLGHVECVREIQKFAG